MDSKIKSQAKFLMLILVMASVTISCKKNQDAKLPSITLKSGGNYTSSDVTVTTSDLINIGIIADKNDADLKSFKIYWAIGNGAFSLKKTYYLTTAENSHYEKDYEFIPSNKDNSETWKFEINDAGGNVNSISIRLTIH